jgi:predicted RNA binding protein YcfA (HicA-like mRNA interferase family)
VTDLPATKAAEVIRALERLGFRTTRTTGSHVILKHRDGRWCPVPFHQRRDIDPGLVRTILRQAQTSPEEFLAALRR